MIYQQLINGLMLGASYSLVAIGYTLIFGVLGLLYFAHGEVFMVGAFVGLYLVVYGGANIYVALAGATIACGILAPAKAADVVLIDAPEGGTQETALAAIKHGDIAAIGAVITAGVPRFVGRSRNTPATTRKARVVSSRVMQDFAAAGH